MAPTDHTNLNDIVDPKSGRLQRPVAKFRNSISSASDAEFPAERGRYVLYSHLGCPWSHRANIVRHLKGLQEILPIVILGPMGPEGWEYTGELGSATSDPLYGFTKHKHLYLKADPEYTGRYTVPVIWDKKMEAIVSNESADIMRMLYFAFDALLPLEVRESTKSEGGLLPPALVEQIDEMNDWVYDGISNGVREQSR